MGARRQTLTPETTGMTREQILARLELAMGASFAWHRAYAAEHLDEWPVIVTEIITYNEDPDTNVIDGFKHHRLGRAQIDWVKGESE